MGNAKNNIPFLVILGLVTLLFLYLLKPFFFPIFWAAVIAAVFRPLYQWINNRLNRPNLSTAAVFIVFALIVLLPAGIIGSLVFNESVQLYGKLGPDAKNLDKNLDKVISAIADHPYAQYFDVNKPWLVAKTAEVARGITNYIFVSLTALTQNTLGFLVQFAIMLYTLYYFVRDGQKFLRMVARILPLGIERDRLLFERFVVTARSTLKVTLILGGIQGILGGVVFLITGVEGAMIWGLLMILMAILPFFGCAIIWVPVGIAMLLIGHIWEGILILGFGTLVISTVDNLLRPILIGQDVEMHPLLIFLSTLGGIALFGFSGFVIGPIVTSMLLSIWQMYEEISRISAPEGE